MSFKRLEPEDFIISTDSIIAGAFNGSKTSDGAEFNDGISAEYYAAYGGGSIADYFVTITATRRPSTSTSVPTKANVVYHQFANIINGDTDDENLGGKDKLDGLSTFKALVVDRSKFKQAIYPNSFKLGGASADTSSVTYTNAGRRYTVGGGFLYPDIGTVINCGDTPEFECDSEEIITSNYVFVRARNAEFNYSQNPTFINKTTGGVRYSQFITSPQTFITTVGLYNDNGDCLAVAKLSRPLKKDFTKEALIRIKLDF